MTTGPNIFKPFIRGLGYNRVLTLYNGVRQEGQQWGLNRNQKLIELYGDEARYLPFIPPPHTRSEVRASFAKPAGAFAKIYVRAEIDHYAAQEHFYGVDNTKTYTAGYALLNVETGATVTNRAKKERF